MTEEKNTPEQAAMPGGFTHAPVSDHVTQTSPPDHITHTGLPDSVSQAKAPQTSPPQPPSMMQKLDNLMHYNELIKTSMDAVNKQIDWMKKLLSGIF
jgi:hypothetical protein